MYCLTHLLEQSTTDKVVSSAPTVLFMYCLTYFLEQSTSDTAVGSVPTILFMYYLTHLLEQSPTDTAVSSAPTVLFMYCLTHLLEQSTTDTAVSLSPTVLFLNCSWTSCSNFRWYSADADVGCVAQTGVISDKPIRISSGQSAIIFIFDLVSTKNVKSINKFVNKFFFDVSL